MDESGDASGVADPFDDPAFCSPLRGIRSWVWVGKLLAILGALALFPLAWGVLNVWGSCLGDPDAPRCSAFAWWAGPCVIPIIGGIVTIVIARMEHRGRGARIAACACCVAVTLVATALCLIKALSYLP